ncbi:tetratricopeptide repeat protein [Pajaroellobacter abortibovis]|uniref:Uncharacterized protein n=1 Tax=Pajaroellobacter abortibovis TaxID=1882918 RepID=A0A1L6MW68_9BACT|nr:tetratricopeptide repeat protein [Pajaroellobacter abortibovis]APR99793.1 hypothetical protein BCY86_03210 [Pajaroellobacter abortibovis]
MIHPPFSHTSSQEESLFSAFEQESPPIEFQLAIARNGVGLELTQPVSIHFLEFVDLFLFLGAAKFPLDVSGGVARFRHCQGELQRIQVEFNIARFCSWIRPRLAGIIGPTPPQLWILPREMGATVGLGGEEPLIPPIERPLLAFEIAVFLQESDLTLEIYHARGIHLTAPPTQLAIATLQAMTHPFGQPNGASFLFKKSIRSLTHWILHQAGVAPCRDDRIPQISFLPSSQGWTLQTASRESIPSTNKEAIYAKEANEWTRTGDLARSRGELDKAKAFDRQALSKAPYHPEISRRIAEISLHHQANLQEAIDLLIACHPSHPPRPWLLLASLYDRLEFPEDALSAWIQAGEQERIPPLAAYAYQRAAEREKNFAQSLLWFERAMDWTPQASSILWTRLHRCLEAAAWEQALKDTDTLIAQTEGNIRQARVMSFLASLWETHHQTEQAATLYEQALTLDVQNLNALIGLGTCFIAQGQSKQGISLLYRALDTFSPSASPPPSLLLTLAWTLAEKLHDLASAIARIQNIPDSAEEAAIARGLEARWRASLGDTEGAEQAFNRMHTRIHEERTSLWKTREESLHHLLLEAVMFARDIQRDLTSARIHLKTLLHWMPHDPQALALHHELEQEIPSVPSPLADIEHLPLSTEETAEEERENRRIEELREQLQANPTDDLITDELIALLTRRQRTHELLALLCARLEEADQERRTTLLPHTLATLQNLEEISRTHHRPQEAALYHQVYQSLLIP